MSRSCFRNTILVLLTVGILTFTASFSAAAPEGNQPSLTLEDRIVCQQAIEQVYWRHRIWPVQNPGPKPALNEVLSASAIRKKVERFLRRSEELTKKWNVTLTEEMVQKEVDRMSRNTKDPEKLKDLWNALQNDRYLVGECLAKPNLVNRMLQTFENRSPNGIAAAELQASTLTPLKPRVGHLAVWTGAEMIIWGGLELQANIGFTTAFDGARWDPATNDWELISLTGVPSTHLGYSAIWTGTEMIVWGGVVSGPTPTYPRAGNRYNPATDTWKTTNSTGAPQGRTNHTLAWTGTELIVWGGLFKTCLDSGCPPNELKTGGRYSPARDTWKPVNQKGAPSKRSDHVAVWSDQGMIVWGGSAGVSGARYDSGKNRWFPITSRNAPPAAGNLAVWSGTEVLVWNSKERTGARYNPETNAWASIPRAKSPSSRIFAASVWTGTELIVWGGGVHDGTNYTAFPLQGNAYRPKSNRWRPLKTTNAPPGRVGHSAVWTGTELIVFAGAQPFSANNTFVFNTGGRYDPSKLVWRSVN